MWCRRLGSTGLGKLCGLFKPAPPTPFLCSPKALADKPVIKGVFTPGKSFSWLSFRSGPKYNVYYLVWCGSFSHCNFRNSPWIWQQTHMCAKNVQSLDKKVWGGEAPVKVINHGYPAWYTLICRPVGFLLPNPDAECVNASAFLCVFSTSSILFTCFCRTVVWKLVVAQRGAKRRGRHNKLHCKQGSARSVLTV